MWKVTERCQDCFGNPGMYSVVKRDRTGMISEVAADFIPNYYDNNYEEKRKAAEKLARELNK